MSARKPYFNTCPCCGANLDPGERCNCLSDERRKDYIEQIVSFCERLSAFGLLQLLSTANRIYVTGPNSVRMPENGGRTA